MRSTWALLAALLVALSAAAPHVHTGPAGRHGCEACAFHFGAQATSTVVVAAPVSVPGELPPLKPAPSPVFGLPLGAVPGQSPPRA